MFPLSITLIASTTENPYFYIYNAILSRSTVFEFKPVPPEEVLRAVRRAFACADDALELEDGVAEHIASACGGDVRKAINAVEFLCTAAHGTVTLEDARTVAQKSSARYDRDGDAHYDILSAFHKSLRGSDPDAAVHYLARLLNAGDLISVCRRMLAAVSEDVGLAYPQAAAIVKALCDTAMQLGLPEAQLPLAQAALLIATAPKSNSVAEAIGSAMRDVEAGRGGDVPAHLKDAHYAGAERLGRGLTYAFPHAYPNHWVRQQYLPDALKDAVYYTPGPNKAEEQARAYWERIKSGNTSQP